MNGTKKMDTIGQREVVLSAPGASFISLTFSHMHERHSFGKLLPRGVDCSTLRAILSSGSLSFLDLKNREVRSLTKRSTRFQICPTSLNTTNRLLSSRAFRWYPVCLPAPTGSPFTCLGLVRGRRRPESSPTACRPVADRLRYHVRPRGRQVPRPTATPVSAAAGVSAIWI